MGPLAAIVVIGLIGFVGSVIYSWSKNEDHIGLDSDEIIVLRGKPHWGMLIPSGLVALITLISILSMSGRMYYSLLSTLIPFFLAALIAFGIDLVRFFLTDLTITNKRIFGKSIVFRVMKIDAPIRHLSFVMIFQGIVGRILGFGKLCVTVTGGKTIPFPGMVDPDNFRKILMNTIDKFDQEKSRQQAEEIANALVKALGK